MRSEIKPGVRGLGLQTPTLLAIIVVQECYREIDADFVITSLIEGKHSSGSIHYKGGAFDCRTRHIPKTSWGKLAETVKSRLGEDYDVVLHKGDAPHLHIEFDPKKPY